MKKRSISYEKLYTELEGFEKNGICLSIDGFDASPMQVVKAHMAREAGSYMRDYELSAKGQIESLSFVNVNSSIYYDQKVRENQLQPLLSD